MSSIYLDFEFHEGFTKPLFGPKRHFIDPISIGMVNENGAPYYRVFNDFDINAAWNSYDLKKVMVGGDMKNIYPEGYFIKKEYFLRENVLKIIFRQLHAQFILEDDYRGSVDMKFTYDNFKYLVKTYGRSREYIAQEIRIYCGNSPTFYGYYSDYDWVAFCSLFGRMIDLPKGYPMYCIDLKQELDAAVNKLTNSDFFTHFHIEAPMSFEEKLAVIKKTNSRYPEQFNEYSALEDAVWNFNLHKFIKTIQK